MASVCLAAALLAAGPAFAGVAIVVRHAEKVDESADPPLSSAGRRRAAELARALQDLPLAAIYTTRFQRTRATAAPTAAAHSVEAKRLDGTPAEIAATLRQKHAADTVLVVGHSDTVPRIVHALGGPDLPDLPSDAYDNLFVVVFGESGPAQVVRLRYGK
jgi:broad specificity phosphatase PhoE